MVLRIGSDRISIVRAFVEELKDSVPHSSADNDQTLEYVLQGYGWFTMRTDDDVYIQVGIPDQSVLVAVEYALTRGLKDDILQDIARETGVRSYHAIEDGVVSTGLGIVGFRNLEMFPANGPVLTFDRFVVEYLFRVHKAGELVRDWRERLEIVDE